VKTQISRDGFRPDKRYSGVYQQQGRMLTDRDWNEMADVLRARIDEGFADALGTGTPRGHALEIQKTPQGTPVFAPGVVWAGGVAARVAPAEGAPALFGYEQQADFPSPPALPAGQPYTLYADLWERPVLALEDAGLIDPALTGPYDTSTRTRAMAQIKWAPAGRDPENPAHNPPRGNAALTLSVPAGAPVATPGGAVNPVGGSFLFRVEVHDVTWPAGAAPDAASSVVIKWSRENGSRHFRYSEAPASFKTGTWIWETWKPAAEVHLGYAFGSWTPARGALSAQFPALTGSDAAQSFVRRWDGYAVLTQAAGIWSPSDAQATAPGANVTVPSNTLTVRLAGNALELALALQGKTLLPGDAWLVPVRRAVHTPGTQIVAAAPPSSVAHRYVTLAAVSATGDVTVAQKRAPFPVIGRLGAEDVDYDGRGSQNGLFDATHDTVDKALDRLWQLGAEHLAYARPADASVYKGKTVANARQALDLLADVRARRSAYEGRTATPDVQTAADALFARTVRPSAWVTVGGAGQIATLEAAIQGQLAAGKSDIRLWLLPGDHQLGPANIASGASIASGAQLTNLTLAGAGWEARLRLSQDVALRDFASVTFRGLAIESQEGAALTVTGGEVAFLDNRIAGTSKIGLIRLAGAARALFRDNIVEATVEEPATDPAAILAPLADEAAMLQLFSARSPRRFAMRAGQLVTQLQAETAAARLARLRIVSENLNARGLAGHPLYSRLVNELRTSVTAALRFTLAAIREDAVRQSSPGLFLTLDDPCPASLESNQIFGFVSLYGYPGDELSPADLQSARAQLSSTPFDLAADRDLTARNNRMSGFLVAGARIAKIRSRTNTGPLFRRIALSNNTIDSGGNQLLAAAAVSLDANLLTTNAFGWMMADQLLFTGNTARATVNIDVVTPALVATGQSSRINLRTSSAPGPTTA
jgi:hypothetical protein